MTGNAGQPHGLRAGATAVVNESYSFACMRCGFGWEETYEIEHHTRADGTDLLVYVANGAVVPSPLSRPTCGNCGGHLARILPPGRVASARVASARGTDPGHPRTPADSPAGVPDTDRRRREHPRHPWHLAGLLRSLRGAH
ncbi:hypothetical protein [Streptomyces sp. enrichment culture]|uniref:hypothetical protein n=1 Tax=Streptomyces sp. enrichment culture TaxID=1795815 RepID=UPI003F5596A5